MYGAGDVRVEDVADPKLEQPTDALVRIVRACVCGSDLHPYHQMEASAQGVPMGHEFVGVVEAAGSEVSGVKAGDFVISPFAWSDNTCDFCREGFQTSCRHGGFYAANGIGGAQAEAIRVPLADGTLVKAPVAEDSALLPSLLTLSDVFLTGHHAVVRGGVDLGSTVTGIGEGAVGLSAVLAARRLGAERIILMGRHTNRTDLGRQWGATDVVAERGEEGIAKVLDLTGGDGTPSWWRPSVTARPTTWPSASCGSAAPSAESVSRSTRRRRSASPASSARTSPSRVAPPQSAPTSRSCCLRCSTAASSPARCSTVPSVSTTSPPGTGRWTTANRSRYS
jgi:threonine dehydrogenase-like Zn-dependent dehydrogenase